jgi:hypothetical protein
MNSEALVNYSKGSSSVPNNAFKPSKKRVFKPSGRSSIKSAPSSLFFFDFGLETITNRDLDEKFDLYQFHLGGSLFQGFSYYVKTEFGGLKSSESSIGLGNTELVALIEWLGGNSRSGNANLGIIAGVVLPSSENGIGHDRNDQVLGVLSEKSFGRLTSSLSAVHYFLGTSNQTFLDEMNKVDTKFTFMFSRQVKFNLGISFIKTRGLLNAGERFTFTEYSPSMTFSLSPTINMKIGARYNSRNISVSSLSEMTQWDISSGVGNSVYTSLGISL